MKRYLGLIFISIFCCTVLCAKQRNIPKTVTLQMSQKLYRTIKTYPNSAQLMYHILDASSLLDFELKLETIVKNPEDAKKALIKLCEFLDDVGGDDYLDANLLQGLHFTATETLLAKSIYSDYRDEQRAIREQQELKKEEDLIKQWNTHGKEVFDYFSDNQNFIRPDLKTNFDAAIASLDTMTTKHTDALDKTIAHINFIISEKGEVERFHSYGECGSVFSADNFTPAEPASYDFDHLDTTVFVPCKVCISVNEEWDKIKELEIEFKYDKKKKTWKVSSYDPNEEIESDDLEIINEFLESLPIDDPLRENKNSLCVSICKRWIIFYNNNILSKFYHHLLSPKFPLSRKCRIEKTLKNKSSIQRYGEKHWDW